MWHQRPLELSWLGASASAEARAAHAQRLPQAAAAVRACPPGQCRILIAEPQPAQRIGALWAAWEAGAAVFFHAPEAAVEERERVLASVRPALVWGWGEAAECRAIPSRPEAHLPPEFGPWIALPTGGSTGHPRFALHTAQTLETAALGLARVFADVPLSSVVVLPLHHVGGWMQVVRSAATGGSLCLHRWKDLEQGLWPEVCGGGSLLSLVPTQLSRLLGDERSVERLRSCRAIFLGGAAAGGALLEKARALRLPLAPAYGSTETAAQACLLRPERFLTGESGVGAPLPHARIWLSEGGRICVASASVCHGYWGEPGAPSGLRDAERTWLSSDLARCGAATDWEILGRADGCILSGGEKVDPAAVESALRQLPEVAEAFVAGVPDPVWGEAVAAAVAFAPGQSLEEEQLRRSLRPYLPAHAIPKRWALLREWPLNAQGKTDRAALARRLRELPRAEDR